MRVALTAETREINACNLSVIQKDLNLNHIDIKES